MRLKRRVCAWRHVIMWAWRHVIMRLKRRDYVRDDLRVCAPLILTHDLQNGWKTGTANQLCVFQKIITRVIPVWNLTHTL
jgi:hypothetical protein